MMERMLCGIIEYDAQSRNIILVVAFSVPTEGLHSSSYSRLGLLGIEEVASIASSQLTFQPRHNIQ